MGYVIGSPNIPESAIRGKNGECGLNPYHITDGFPNCFEFSDLLWASACLGGLVGGGIQSRIGRVRTIMLNNAIFIVGSLVLGLTFHQAQFVLGRILVGFACGLGGVVAPTYLGEIATVQTRGTMGTLHQLMLVCGLLVSNLVGLAWSTPPGWRFVLAMNGMPALIQCLILPTMVESPRYLVSKQRLQEARLALQRLRGPEGDVDVDLEFQEMVSLLLGQEATAEQKNTAVGLSAIAQPTQRGDSESTIICNNSAIETPYGIVALFRSECSGLAITGVLVHFLQQATGISGLVYYSTSFLSSAFGSGNAKYITVGVSLCSIIATAISIYLVDRVNRKTLMMASCGGVGFSAILMIVGAYCNIGNLVVAAVFLYIATFNIGMGPIPWLLNSEMLPTYALSSASSVATGVNWGTNFIVGLIFPILSKALGNGTFIIFGSFAFFGVAYIWYFVPETRGRTVEMVMADKNVPQRSRK
ncbi:Solute carrier 2, facilitated glucose transporter member 2 [Mortierella alpina]|nr:Solute carrier 2, facilitated glucose transporter member 2 [Mortierella alpina]